MAEPQFFTAVNSFATELPGYGPVNVHKGENVRAGHPLLAQSPHMFKPAEITTRWDTVEQTTAAPGEKRHVGRRAHKPVGSTGMPADPRSSSEDPEANVTREMI